jgi:hypothetical protein
MVEQRETLRDPAGRASVLLLRAPHVYHAERLGASPQYALGQLARRRRIANSRSNLKGGVFHAL